MSLTTIAPQNKRFISLIKVFSLCLSRPTNFITKPTLKVLITVCLQVLMLYPESSNINFVLELILRLMRFFLTKGFSFKIDLPNLMKVYFMLTVTQLKYLKSVRHFHWYLNFLLEFLREFKTVFQLKKNSARLMFSCFCYVIDSLFETEYKQVHQSTRNIKPGEPSESCSEDILELNIEHEFCLFSSNLNDSHSFYSKSDHDWKDIKSAEIKKKLQGMFQSIKILSESGTLPKLNPEVKDPKKFKAMYAKILFETSSDKQPDMDESKTIPSFFDSPPRTSLSGFISSLNISQASPDLNKQVSYKRYYNSQMLLSQVMLDSLELLPMKERSDFLCLVYLTLVPKFLILKKSGFSFVHERKKLIQFRPSSFNFFEKFVFKFLNDVFGFFLHLPMQKNLDSEGNETLFFAQLKY